jgi:hypothetical protein
MRDHEKHGHHLFGHHDWLIADGTVLEVRILHPNRSAPHARLFVVRLDPPGQQSQTVEMTVHPDDQDYQGVPEPKAGEVRGFLYDPKSGKLKFNQEDERNSFLFADDDPELRELEELERLEREENGGY